jgi:cellulose synthase operon protein C
LFSDPDPDVRLAVADAALRVRLRDAGQRVVPWLSHTDARVRQAAAEVLAVLPTPEAVPALGRALSDPQPDVRGRAALALGNSGVPEASLLLLSQLDDSDPDVRAAVIGALEELGDQRAVVPLIGRMQERRVPIRRQAASALGALGDRRAVRALIVTLGDTDASVRAAAAEALGHLRAEEAVWSLGGLFEQEADEGVQRAALSALGRIGTSASAEVLVRAMARYVDLRAAAREALVLAGKAALPNLSACLLQPPNQEVAEGCALALSRIAGAEAQPALEEALRRGSIGPGTALSAFGNSGNVKALPVVLEYLSSSKPAERRAAIDALGRLLEPGARAGIAVEPLVLGLSQTRDSRFERAALIGLLGRTGSARAVAELVPLANASDEYLRNVALEALGSVGPAPEADRALIAALAASAYPLRWTAAVALRRSGSAAAAGTLLELLEQERALDPDAVAFALLGPLARSSAPALVERAARLLERATGSVRDALIEAIGSVEGAAGVRPLLAALAGAGRATRAKIAEALATHGEAEAALRALIGDDEAAVRANAVWALGHAGGADSLSVVQALVRDRSTYVAANAVAALGLLAHRHKLSVAAPLCPLLEDDRSYVRVNALASLRVAGQSCQAWEGAQWLLLHDASDEVRLAAAQLLAQTADAEAGNRNALQRCAARDTSGNVAAACAAAKAPTLEPPGTAIGVSVVIVTPQAASGELRAPFALVRADGLVRLGWADRRGSAYEARTPKGPLRLALPAAFTE